MIKAIFKFINEYLVLIAIWLILVLTMLGLADQKAELDRLREQCGQEAK